MEPELHNFRIGDKVIVFNRQLGGKFVIEGKAKIAYVRHSEDMYEVQFLDEHGLVHRPIKNHLRYVDPNGQDDPDGYLQILNR